MSQLTPIYTLTGNLLAERTLEYDTWAIGKTERATRESFNTRGKGVNVSNMLARLGTDSTALIFAGGPSGAESEAWLHQRGITYRNFETKQAARTGTVIWSEQQAETTFLGPNAVLDADAINAGAAFLHDLPDHQVLALCGSFPGWSGNDYEPLRREIKSWARRGHLYVDAYGPPLQDIVALPIELIKINRQEFDAFYSEEERGQSVESRLRAAGEKWPVKNWVISNGPDSVWMTSSEGDPIEFAPPNITEVSPTGSGDVLFAVILHGLLTHQLPLAKAVEAALPYASANAAHPGVADFEIPLQL